MEMNNLVFYKVNLNSSCFVDIKLKRVFLKCINFKIKELLYFLR